MLILSLIRTAVKSTITYLTTLKQFEDNESHIAYINIWITKQEYLLSELGLYEADVHRERI